MISLRDDSDREALATAMGSDALPEDRDDLVAAISAWTSGMDKSDGRRNACSRPAFPRRR